jgi:hypothetical protein
MSTGALLAIVLALTLYVRTNSPSLSKDQAISVALARYTIKPQRMDAKLMRRSDLLRVQPQVGSPVSGKTDDYIWVVAVSGDFGVEPTMSSDRNSWGAAVIADQSAKLQIWINGSRGDWPPFFDALPDLSTR